MELSPTYQRTPVPTRSTLAATVWCALRTRDAAAVFVLCALGLAAEWDRLVGPTWIGMDTATAFFPWYAFLGEQLRAGHLPLWNAHQFAGTPFAADPESGWMYLPAMLAFTALPLDAAIRAHLLFHVLLGALSMYALARILGSNVVGGVLAATIYAHSGFFEGYNVCCFAYADVAAWLPLTLLGVERALRASTRSHVGVWWGVAGFAFSQVLAAWIGQGAYYAALVLGSYLLVRWLQRGGKILDRSIASLFANGAGVALFACCLGAAGVLPRVEYNAVSNLPGGYPDLDVSLFDTTWSNWGFVDGWERLMVQPGFGYIGWLAMLLALVGVFVPSRMPIAYFAVLPLVTLVLARADPTPLHAAFALLPGFERLHGRSPSRVLLVFNLAPALLAAATLTWFELLKPRLGKLAPYVDTASAALVCAVAVSLYLGWRVQAADSLAGGGDYQFQTVDLDRYFAPTGATRFLADQQSSTGPFRYFGFAQHIYGDPMPYTLRWTDPSIAALEVNNRALLSGLEDVQGYNPLHIARYDQLVAAINGHSQNYHHTDVFASGLDSPLLDLLNVRYILMPSRLASDEITPTLRRPLDRVYADDQVTIYMNPSARPRAWLVHAAAPLTLAALRTFDPRHTALLEADAPSLGALDLLATGAGSPGTPAGVSVTVAASPEAVPAAPDALPASRDSVELVDGAWRVRTDAAGLLVLSEIAYPAWHAYVDGNPVPTFVADVALRAVAVPPGEHTVEMRYESLALRAGLLLTAAATLVWLGLALTALRGRTGRRCARP